MLLACAGICRDALQHQDCRNEKLIPDCNYRIFVIGDYEHNMATMGENRRIPTRAAGGFVQWAQCGEGLVTAAPTVLWAVGAVLLAQRMIAALFRRFAFRRVPFWELVLQLDNSVGPEDAESCQLMQLWVVWMLAAGPLAYYLYTRAKPESQPLMIWITTNPWQRREMGPYGYYLNRPPSAERRPSDSGQRPCALRRALSDSTVIRDGPRKKRYSKSV
uniref:Uncharacterized protein n=1 Tax=Bombyx mori TaxID=7091 RepID=A0A8R2DJY1_BOMMO|nr:uncharacterized protein LOC101736090 isoform X3 [Bombyx mori]